LVIVVDDGSATGATMIAALRATRAKQPFRLVGAVAVAPPPTLAHLEAEADEIVCLEAPDAFYAVGQFFEDFSQVTDDEVATIIEEAVGEAALPKRKPRLGTTLHGT
jgi:predicted phosphoribosyltransferase